MTQKFKALNEATVPLSSLKEDPDNANRHTDENLAGIKASLQRFGQVERLVVRKADKVVFAGNGRLQVLKELGHKSARVQFVAGTDAECRAYALAANQTPRLSRFDDAALLRNLEEIQREDTTGLLAATTFNAEDLDQLRASLEEDHEAKKNSIPAGRGGAMATCPHCGEEFRLGGKKA